MLQVRGVLGGTTVAGDVVLQTSPVVKERETVMGLVTEVNMTDMLAVLEISSVEVIIVNSLAIIITRKMTAVRSPNFLKNTIPPPNIFLMKIQTNFTQV